MSDRLERTLAAMDVGLQSSDEHGYPDRFDHDGLCARCLRAEQPEEGDLCAGCRSWCLGDSDIDPARPPDFFANDVGGSSSRFEFHVSGVGRIQRLDSDGQPVGEPVELSGLALHHRDGNPRNNDMSNLELVPVAENASRPAAYRVASSIDVPEWLAVTCEPCRAVYACDPQRTSEARDIMRNDGHGWYGLCTLGVALEDSDRLEHDQYLALRENALRRLAEGLEIDPELVGSAGGVYDWAREEHHRLMGMPTVEQVQELQRRIERNQ